MTELKGRVAFITGGARGLGAASARALARLGAKVVLADLNLEHATSTAETLKGEGFEAAAVRLDVSDREMCNRVAAEIRDDHGPVSFVVNNAGIVAYSRIGDPEAPAEWDRSIDVNLNGTFNVTRAFLDDLKETKGAIVNIASVAAFTSGFGQAGYTASKGGVRAFTQAMCRELSQFGIRVNAVAPGYIETEGMGGKGNPMIEEFLQFHCPMKRHGKPEEIGSVVAFLCTSGASFVSGATIPVDGGYLTI
jgi:NAD(P)-dependent dehydrogenase (short-subunit alcohol dehydrogenase family)